MQQPDSLAPAPPDARVTYNFGMKGPWYPATLSLGDGQHDLRLLAADGREIKVPLSALSRVGIDSMFVSLRTNSPLPGTSSNVINIAFGDGAAFFRNATKGT